MDLFFKKFPGERERKGCQMEETPTGVTVAIDQFDCEDEMQFALAVMEDSFKNLMIWCISTHLISLDWILMKIMTGGQDLWKLSQHL